MSLPRTVREVLDEHTTLEVESIDRMYLNVYVPPLQYDGGVATFFRKHRGHPFASSVLMAPISQAFIAAIEAFVAEHRVPLITFEKRQRKDDVMAAHLARFTVPEGVLFVGKAQEKDDKLTGISQFSHEHRDRLLGRVVVCHDLEQFPCSHVVEGHARVKRRTGTDLAPEIKATTSKVKQLRLTPEAELDLDEAYNWYRAQAPGLAASFSWRRQHVHRIDPSPSRGVSTGRPHDATSTPSAFSIRGVLRGRACRDRRSCSFPRRGESTRLEAQKGRIPSQSSGRASRAAHRDVIRTGPSDDARRLRESR
jgi:hypothetical protein